MPLSNKYYTQHSIEAAALMTEQVKDGWTTEDILDYWLALGYNLEFTIQLMREVAKERCKWN